MRCAVYGYGGVSRMGCRNGRSNGSLSALEKVDGVVQSDRVEHSWEVVVVAGGHVQSAEVLPLHTCFVFTSLHFLGGYPEFARGISYSWR
jgi:hypothetical protein